LNGNWTSYPEIFSCTAPSLLGAMLGAIGALSERTVDSPVLKSPSWCQSVVALSYEVDQWPTSIETPPSASQLLRRQRLDGDGTSRSSLGSSIPLARLYVRLSMTPGGTAKHYLGTPLSSNALAFRGAAQRRWKEIFEFLRFLQNHPRQASP